MLTDAVPTRKFVHGSFDPDFPAASTGQIQTKGVAVRLPDGTADNHVGYEANEQQITYFAEYMITESGFLEVYYFRHELPRNATELRISGELATTYAPGAWVSVTGRRTTSERVANAGI